MEYERLTEQNGAKFCRKKKESVANWEIVERLAELEDKIEQGTLIEQNQGEWLLEKTPDGKPYCFHCSVCDSNFRQVGNKTKTDYCPDCGAKMRD